ncbi:hypothetical protein EVAR_52033_1 [Eumeta japonica]|uniref:Uncharacterized protein n=1 Tax=Eumeta variegata TaxID=151549 RepID=A0A4C1YZ09_EUMVA|nr:hypothetical protein EVAR_52033_1 [Eumeta japonica]
MTRMRLPPALLSVPSVVPRAPFRAGDDSLKRSTSSSGNELNGSVRCGRNAKICQVLITTAEAHRPRLCYFRGGDSASSPRSDLAVVESCRRLSLPIR